MARQRDFRAEYARRIASAEARGLSRSQARGHARSGEAPIKLPRISAPLPEKNDPREIALRELRQTGNQTKAAKAAGISPERFRRFLRENALAERIGRNWRITDGRPRRMLVLSEGARLPLDISGFENLSLVGRHLNAVNSFIETNDIEVLAPFEGRSVIDVNGVAHLLETRPNVLHRLAADGESFPEIYRFVQ